MSSTCFTTIDANSRAVGLVDVFFASRLDEEEIALLVPRNFGNRDFPFFDLESLLEPCLASR